MSQKIEEDIINDTIYSLQEDKLHTEEDNKKNLAERKKQKVVEAIENLRQKFAELLKKNQNHEGSFRLTVIQFPVILC